MHSGYPRRLRGCQYAKIGRIGEVAIARPWPRFPMFDHCEVALQRVAVTGTSTCRCRSGVSTSATGRRSSSPWTPGPAQPLRRISRSAATNHLPPATHARQRNPSPPSPHRTVWCGLSASLEGEPRARPHLQALEYTRQDGLAAADRARWSTTPRYCSRSTMRRPAQITTCSRVAPCCRSASPIRRRGRRQSHR